jgi:hypothetical protein
MRKPGRPAGYVVSEKSRLQSSKNNPDSRKISTPFGEYHSIRAASRLLNISPNLVHYYCILGEKQRNGDNLVSKVNGKALKNYTAWIKHENPHKIPTMIDNTADVVSSFPNNSVK